MKHIFFLLSCLSLANCQSDDVDCVKKRKFNKLMKRVQAAKEDEERKQEDSLRSDLDKYSALLDEEEEKNQGLILGHGGSMKELNLPAEMVKDCRQFNNDDFTKEPSILASQHQGRLGNQMSSFASMYALSKLQGSKIRLGLSNNQYLMLSDAFPYFEEHAKEHAIAAIYCNYHHLNWSNLIKNANINYLLARQDYEAVSKSLENSVGKALDMGPYVNIPLIYKDYLEELRTKHFIFRDKYIKGAKETIERAKKLFTKEPDAVIGIHGRFTDYSNHLKLRNAHLARHKYYAKAIQYFRDMYNNPLFVVVSDNPNRAKKVIFNNKESVQDMFFVGTIDKVLEKEISKKESTSYDLAILAQCDHIIISHGTFGLWAAFLASTENTHIMAHNLASINDNNVKPIEELDYVKAANFKNIIFMDDK